MAKSLKQRQLETGRTLALDGAAWRRLRAAVLADEPLCRMCWQMGRTTAATDVDHINNDPTDNRRESLQPLCRECHSRKTAADMGKRVNMGCDVRGYPLDPNHPWNQPDECDKLMARLRKSPATDSGKPNGTPSFNADCLKNRQ